MKLIHHKNRLSDLLRLFYLFLVFNMEYDKQNDEYFHIPRDEVIKLKKKEKSEVEMVLISSFNTGIIEKIAFDKRTIKTRHGEFKFHFESSMNKRSKTVTVDRNSIEIRKYKQIDKLLDNQTINQFQHNVARLYNVGYSLNMRSVIKSCLNFDRYSGNGGDDYSPSEGCEFLKRFYQTGNYELSNLGYLENKVVEMMIINDLSLKSITEILKVSYLDVECAICNSLDFLRNVKKKC